MKDERRGIQDGKPRCLEIPPTRSTEVKTFIFSPPPLLGLLSANEEINSGYRFLAENAPLPRMPIHKSLIKEFQSHATGKSGARAKRLSLGSALYGNCQIVMKTSFKDIAQSAGSEGGFNQLRSVGHRTNYHCTGQMLPHYFPGYLNPV